MQRITRIRPTPAMVVASIALLVALGGTSFAAVSKLAPPNSVGTAAVINNSLLKKDFKAGQLPAGSTDAFSRTVAGERPLTTASTSIATLAIPKPGKYVIWAKAFVESANPEDTVICKLTAGAASDSGRVYLARNNAGATVSYVLAYSSAAAGKADLECTSPVPTSKASASQIELVAIKVATLTSA